jgi:hypothetical protein
MQIRNWYLLFLRNFICSRSQIRDRRFQEFETSQTRAPLYLCVYLWYSYHRRKFSFSSRQICEQANTVNQTSFLQVTTRGSGRSDSVLFNPESQSELGLQRKKRIAIRTMNLENLERILSEILRALKLRLSGISDVSRIKETCRSQSFT